MKIIDIPPKFLSDELALKICNNKKLKKKYIIKYKKNLFGGVMVMKDFIQTQ